MITIERLTMNYGPAVAVDDVTLTAAPGRVTGYPGPSGGGESQDALFAGGVTSEQWAQLAVTSSVCLLLPLAVGVRSLLWAEVK